MELVKPGEEDLFAEAMQTSCNVGLVESGTIARMASWEEGVCGPGWTCTQRKAFTAAQEKV